MIEKAMDVMKVYPVRKSKKQKAAFRDAVASYVGELGYCCRVEKDVLGVQNVIIGDPNRAKVLITAHYDTCAHLPFPNFVAPCNLLVFLLYQVVLISFIFGFAILAGLGWLFAFGNIEVAIGFMYFSLLVLMALMLFGPANRHNANDNTSGVVAVLEIARTLPEELKDKVCFVLFDLEEAGLIGSTAYYMRHRKVAKRQVVFNLDCVGEGDDFVLFPKKKIVRDTRLRGWLRGATDCDSVFGKRVSLRVKGFSFFPSDQAVFPYGIGVGAFSRSILGFLYLGKVHTNRDRTLQEENVEFLKTQIIGLVQKIDVFGEWVL